MFINSHNETKTPLKIVSVIKPFMWISFQAAIQKGGQFTPWPKSVKGKCPKGAAQMFWNDPDNFVNYYRDGSAF